MNKRKITLIIIMFFVLLVVLIACVKCNHKPIENSEEKNNESQNIEDLITKLEDNTELYTSTNGYELRYDPNNFSIKYENGIEKFVHRTEDAYLKIYIVDSSEVEKTKESIKENSNRQGECSFANGSLVGYYTEENQDNNKIKRNFMFDLNNKNMLVIEAKMFASTEKDKVVNEQINMMIETIILQEQF